MQNTEKNYDAIVIGSGIGALTFAAIMAKLKKWRVLVLERHFKLGGFTHSFERPGGWSWDVGLHYVGQMGEGMMGRRLFDLISGGAVAWKQLPDEYDHFVYPGLDFGVPSGKTKFQEALIRAFPQERSSIERYFRDLTSVQGWFSRHVMAKASPRPLAQLVNWINRLTGGLALTTTKQYLEKRFRDPRLRAVVASQWGDYGVPPSRSAFATHALIATHYFHGAWYPEGGAGEIAKAVGAVIRKAGGELLPNHEVTRILLENDRAVGVEVQVKKGKQWSRLEFRAPCVVSDAGAWNTFMRLLPQEFPLPFRDELAGAEGFGAVQLFLGLRRDPRELGFRGENHWIFTSFDHDDLCARRDELLDGHALWGFLSFPSLKQSGKHRHTAEIIAPLSYEALKAYREQPWRRRSADYEAAKARMTEALLDLAEQHYPGFRELVEYCELGTPLSFEHFTAAPGGAIYGYPGTPERYRKTWLAAATPVRNLYLTGTDAGSLGIMGALMGGVATASHLLEPFGFFKIMRAANSFQAKPAKTRETAAAAVGT
jgi:all-trans-retinol 13,14-reductase